MKDKTTRRFRVSAVRGAVLVLVCASLTNTADALMVDLVEPAAANSLGSAAATKVPWKKLSQATQASAASQAVGLAATNNTTNAAEFVVVYDDQEGKLNLPELDNDGIKALGAVLESKALSTDSKALAEANSTLFALSNPGAAVAVTSGALVAATAAFDRTAAALAEDFSDRQRALSGINEASLALMTEAQRASYKADAARVEATGNQVVVYSLRGASTDEANYNRLKVLPATTIPAMNNIVPMVVAISQPEVGFLGTGFMLPNGVVITAAHVLEHPIFWKPAPAGGGAQQPDFSTLRVNLVQDAGTFDTNHPAMVDSARSKVEFVRDVAILSLSNDQSAEAGALVTAARAAAGKTKFDTVGETLQQGVVYGLAAEKDGSRLTPAWLPPGAIVFAERTRIPTAGNANNASIEFVRGVRAEMFATCAFPALRPPGPDGSSLNVPCQCGTNQYLQARNALLREYDCAPGADECFFSCDLGGNSRLPTISGDPQLRRIRCVGTDIVSVDGNSGAPLIRLSDGIPTVVGVHLGRSRGESSYPELPSLSNFARAVPFHVFAGDIAGM